MSDRSKRLLFTSTQGGRNGTDPPFALKEDECADAINVDWFQSTFGRKIGGVASVGVTFSSGGPFASTLIALYRHVPSVSQTAAELWAVDFNGLFGRMAAATTFTAPTLKDAATFGAVFSTACQTAGLSINGKCMWAYKTAVDRMHVWDGSTVRRTGLAAATTAPVITNTGAGTYAATPRYYRERLTYQSAGITLRRSEPSPPVSFTPSGTGTAAHIVFAAAVSEGETHVEVEAGTDNVTFYRIATVAIATTSWDDSVIPANYSNSPLSALTGTYTLQKSYRYIAGDQNRMLGYGSYTSTDKQNRIEISAVIGSTDVSDEERVDTTTNYYLDLDELDSGEPMGLGGPVSGCYLAFKRRQTYLLTPTGNVALPFRKDRLSESIGCVGGKSIAVGINEDGQPALYWLSHLGPYRWTLAKGLQFIGHGVMDLVIGPTGTLLLGDTAFTPPHVVFHGDKKQVWFWWNISAAPARYANLIYDTTLNAWSRVLSSDGISPPQHSCCSVMFANTIGASMSEDLKPYVGQLITYSPFLWKIDTGLCAERAYIITRAVPPGGFGFYGAVGDATLGAAATTGASVSVTALADYGAQSGNVATVSLTPLGAETRVTRRAEDSRLAGDVAMIQLQVGDAAAVTSAWNLDYVVVPQSSKGPISQ